MGQFEWRASFTGNDRDADKNGHGDEGEQEEEQEGFGLTASQVNIFPFSPLGSGSRIEPTHPQEISRTGVVDFLSSVFDSKRVVDKVTERFDAYHDVYDDFPSLKVLQCQDKSFFVDDVHMSNMHANVLMKHLAGRSGPNQQAAGFQYLSPELGQQVPVMASLLSPTNDAM